MDTPHLIVLVDAEEAFDWRKPFSRQSTCVDHFRHIERVQNVLDDAGIRPAYLCNYPVISDAFAADRLRGFSDDGRAEIGTHLHPWVTPPDIEEVSNRNSFLGNLPLTLQHQKLDMMQRTHERVFGVQPRMFMAGRYGLGADTLGLLTQNGFLVDVSIAASMDFATDG
ncbi:MAG: WalW protein, partial [Pseudomonadota bacterium]